MNSHEAQAKIESLLRTLIQHSGLSLAFTAAPTPSALTVTFTGPDVPILIAHNAELLLAFEHIGAKTLGLTPEQHDQISFDAGGFKATRDRQLQAAAREAVLRVRTTGKPYSFPPMNSRERRLLHLALANTGLETASEGEGPQRHLVLHPPSSLVIP